MTWMWASSHGINFPLCQIFSVCWMAIGAPYKGLIQARLQRCTFFLPSFIGENGKDESCELQSIIAEGKKGKRVQIRGCLGITGPASGHFEVISARRATRRERGIYAQGN